MREWGLVLASSLFLSTCLSVHLLLAIFLMSIHILVEDGFVFSANHGPRLNPNVPSGSQYDGLWRMGWGVKEYLCIHKLKIGFYFYFFNIFTILCFLCMNVGLFDTRTSEF